MGARSVCLETSIMTSSFSDVTTSFSIKPTCLQQLYLRTLWMPAFSEVYKTKRELLLNSSLHLHSLYKSIFLIYSSMQNNFACFVHLIFLTKDWLKLLLIVNSNNFFSVIEASSHIERNQFNISLKTLHRKCFIIL